VADRTIDALERTADLVGRLRGSGCLRVLQGIAEVLLRDLEFDAVRFTLPV
jgi:hypothetical protein